MSMEKSYRLGFIRFEEDKMGFFPARLGTIPGRRSLVTPIPAAMGFCTVRTDQRNFQGAELRVRNVEEGPSSLKFLLSAPDDSFTVESFWKYDEDSGIISRRDTFFNTGKEKRILRRFLPKIDFQSGDFEVYTQQCRWGMESSGQWQDLHAGCIELRSRQGRWTEGGTPFAVLRTHESQEALAFHLIPNGDYVIRFTAAVISTQKPDALLEYGLCTDALEAEILPGEKMEAPELLIQRLPNREAWSGSAMLHRYANQHLCAEWKPVPVLYNTWLDKMAELDVPRMRRELAAAKKAGCEVFVIDSGWFIEHGNWQETTEQSFFGKMKDFADETRAAGLGFGIWIEPEFFNPDVPVVKEHPEWFLTTDERWEDAKRRIDFTKPGAADYYYEMIASLIRTYGLAYIKFDMNTTLGQDPSGQELAKYIEGIHGVMLRLRRDFPGTILENCSSGAMRSTLAELPYFDLQFVSDNANVLDVLHISQGTFLRMPAGRIMRWLVLASSDTFRPWEYSSEEFVVQPQNATWKHYEETDLTCGLLASMTGVLGFSGDLASLREDTLQKIAEFSKYYKENRESLQCSEATLLTPPETIDRRHGIIAFLMSDPKRDKHFLFVFYRNCDGYSRLIFRLPADAPRTGLCRNTEYKVVPLFGNQEGVSSVTASGAMLADEGLEIPVTLEQHGDFKGLLWEITKQ